MAQRRHRAGGFTLTEVLMAVGILGIGMTMVATIFPVAVNQSREADISTQAALQARSIGAYMRMQKDDLAEEAHRRVAAVFTWPTNNLASWSGWKGEFGMYAPNEFLYQRNRSYSGGANPWGSGHLAPQLVVGAVDAGGTSTRIKGPWRVAIVLYRARGDEPTPQNYASGEAGRRRARPGEYILDPSRGRCEVYMIDSIDFKNNDSPGDDNIYVAPGRTREGDEAAKTSWRDLPGAVAVYHTILGD